MTRQIELQLFPNNPGGLPGNDDAGALSSWLVFADIGLYPEIPGVGGFVLGSPLFSSITLNLPGHTVQINAPAAADASPYVQSLTLNGVPSTSLWLPISTTFANATTTLNFALGPAPNTAWGSQVSDAPPAFAPPGPAPSIVVPPAASANPVTGITTQLSVLGSNSTIVYDWGVVAEPAGAANPTFSVNDSTAASGVTVTFFKAGNYTFQVDLSGGDDIVPATVLVLVQQTPTGLLISPGNTAISPSSSQQFTATSLDQFGNVISAPPTTTWSLAGGIGTITPGGLYTAPSSPGAATIMGDIAGAISTTRINVRPIDDVTSGLIGRWNFDDGAGSIAADSSPSANHPGTIVGATWDQPGKVGSGDLLFNGANSYVRVADSPDLDPTAAITLAAWIKAIDWNGNRRILQKGDPNGANSGDNQYRLTAESGVLKFDLYGVGTVSAALPSVGVWHYVAGTWDGATMKLYVDGAVVASAAVGGNIAVTSAPLTIGAKNTVSTNTGNYFHGDLDDVRIYNRSLSAAEIATVMSQPAQGPEVMSVYVIGTGWTTPGYAVPSGSNQLLILPWGTINQVQVRFNEPVSISQASLTLAGSRVASYAISDFSYNAGQNLATWTFAGPIGSDHLVLSLTNVTDSAGNGLDGIWTDAASAFPSGDGASGAPFTFHFNILPGDINQDGIVDFADLVLLAQHYGQSGTFAQGDLTGDGTVNFAGLVILAQDYGRSVAASAFADLSSVAQGGVIRSGLTGRARIARPSHHSVHKLQLTARHSSPARLGNQQESDAGKPAIDQFEKRIAPQTVVHRPSQKNSHERRRQRQQVESRDRPAPDAGKPIPAQGREAGR